MLAPAVIGRCDAHHNHTSAVGLGTRHTKPLLCCWLCAFSQLTRQVPPERQETMAAVARRRLPGVTCVLEGLYDQGNIGAVARSAESFGVPNLGVVCLHGDRYKNKHTRRTGVGADKWVNFTKFESTEDCYRRLREEGTKIFVSSCDTRALDTDTTSTGYAGAGPGLATLPPGEAEISSTALHNVNWGVGPIAVVFGNEYLGLSEAAVTLVRCTAVVKIARHENANGFSAVIHVWARLTKVSTSRLTGSRSLSMCPWRPRLS